MFLAKTLAKQVRRNNASNAPKEETPRAVVVEKSLDAETEKSVSTAIENAKNVPEFGSDVKTPVVETPVAETVPPAIKNPDEKPPSKLSLGGARQLVDPLTSFLLNMMFIALLYFVATKIFTFYGVSTEVYGLYFTFYLFLYLTTLLLPTEYPKI